MRDRTSITSITSITLSLVAGALLGCGGGVIGGGGGPADLAGGGPDMAAPADLWGVDFRPPPPNACGDNDPGCMVQKVPSMSGFPLQSDPNPKPGQTDNGVDRDMMGAIFLSATKSSFDFVWAANSEDWGIGTVSKLDSKTVKEVARYFTVTCFSNPGGSKAACDGVNGCCARDDYPDYQYRVANQGKSSGKHQSVQRSANNPSRTAVDFNGDMWVSNRAFSGQSSVTKIAHDPAECKDRNGEPGIQTSRDVNADGLIDTDCNNNGVPDDVADVKAKACNNGKAQEFFGWDDECILFTTNTNVPLQYGRPLTLGRGSIDAGPADAWAGTYQDGKFFRIDGTTGMTKAQAQVGTAPYGATVDASGILWAPQLGGPNLYYFDTGAPQNSGTVRQASFGMNAYGIALDRDQNIWLGGYPNGNAYRYTPDRTAGNAKLGAGFWTVIQNPGSASGTMDVARGIAADSRSQGAYFVWMGRHPNWIIQIPASTIPKPQGADVTVNGAAFKAILVGGSQPAGVGVDTDQNIWAIATGDSVATKIKVDVNGNATAPDITSGAKYQGCPVGDRCHLRFQSVATGGQFRPEPGPYTYSDFTGFGLRNFTNPKGTYGWVQPGCVDQETHWLKVNYDADVPTNTSLTVRARTGKTPLPDNTWSAWSGEYQMSPADLTKAPGPVADPAPYIQIEFILISKDKAASPRLKSFEIVFKCGNKIG